MNYDDSPSNDEPQEPTAEEIAEVLGEERIDVPLPYGRHPVADMAQKALRQIHEPEEVAPALVIEDTSGSTAETPSAQAREQYEEQPPTLEAAILALPSRWMRVYIVALYETGDPVAARRVVSKTLGTLLPGTLSKFQRSCPEFGQLCADHAQTQHEAVYAAVYKGATEGHDIPLVSQGAIVGSYKKPCVKSAELYLKANGLMAADQVNVTHTGRVEIADESQMAEMLAGVAKLLFPEPKVIGGKGVS